MATKEVQQSRIRRNLLGVMIVSLPVAFVVLVVIVAIFGMDRIMDVMHEIMTQM